MADYGSTDRVRRRAAEQYVRPARMRGEETLTIHSGTFGKELVQAKLLAPDRFPIVCGALESTKFQKDNGLTLLEVCGPKSGKSSTVSFVYRLNTIVEAEPPMTSAFDDLRGLLKDTYQKLGGAESFHESERTGWER